MPASTDSRTKRLLDLVVLLLDAKHPVSYGELREQFTEYRSAKPEAGMRAFERDKATLLELGVPIRWITGEEPDGAGEGGYIIDRQKYRLPEVTLTPDEVAALVVTASAARHQPEFPYRQAAEMAVRKLMFDLAGLGTRAKRRRPTSGLGSGPGKAAHAGPPGPTASAPVTGDDQQQSPWEREQPRDVLVHMPSAYRSRSLGEYLAQLEESVRLRKRVTIKYDHQRSTPALGTPSAEAQAAAVSAGPDSAKASSVSPFLGDSAGVPQAVPSLNSEKWYVGTSSASPPKESEGHDAGAGSAPPRTFSHRDVDPYGLVYRQGAWLLVGYCHSAAGVRRFRVDRILDLKIAPKPKSPDFEVPAGFSLQEHGSFSPWRFEREAPGEVQLFVSAETPWVAEEDFGEARRAPHRDGDAEGVAVDFRCGNPDYLISRVLGAAGALRVLQPEALRRRVADAAAAVARRNHGFTSA